VKADGVSRAPYPGLRSFRREEADLFFGREECVGSMVDRLKDTHFLAVLGSSGTGKSSVVKTGLLDALEVGLMASAGSNWRVVEFRPGGAPLNNLARHLLEAEQPVGEVSDAEIALLRGFLARGPRAIIEWCRDGHLPKGTNLLLLADQFEELFRYQDYSGREEAEALVALLLESAHNPEFPIYVTITMRSEYLGACTLIQGLAEAISAGMVLTPRMTRGQCRAAIEGPAAVCRIKIEGTLVNRLLNDLANFAPWDEGDKSNQLDRLGRRADQLPLLQYTLNRMWMHAREAWTQRDRKPDGEPIKLRLSDYEAIGGLGGALNAHVDQILKGLTDRGLGPVVETIFRSLISGTTVADAVRRPTRFGELVALCDGNKDAVRAVVDAFREPGCNFLLPELDPKNPKELGDGTFIDISHESLIRQWKELSGWVATEASSAQHWRRLRDNMAAGYLIRGKELGNLVAWRDQSKPNKEWVNRYGGDYAAAIAFLNASKQSEHAELRRKTLVRRAIVAAVIAVFVFSTVVFYVEERSNTEIALRSEQMAQSSERAAQESNARLQALLDLTEKMKTQFETVRQDNTNLKSENDALKAQLSTMSSAAAVVSQPLIKLGPIPVLPGYADELADDDVKPTGNLEANVNSPTPRTFPDGNLLTTRQLYDALASGKLKDAGFLLIDAWSDLQHPTIPTAKRLPVAGKGGAFGDATQTKMFDEINRLTQNWKAPVVFFSRDAKSWECYNAALRAIEMGFGQVYWYRGGLASWRAADQPVEPVQTAN
jgi:hypothetical protein